MAAGSLMVHSQPDPWVHHTTRLLASVRSVDEALIALVSGADIIDAKDPTLGALGALHTQEISTIVTTIQGRCPISATTGDWTLGSPELLNAYQAIQNTGVDYIKVGLFGVHDEATLRHGLAQLPSPSQALQHHPHRIAVILADQGIPLWPLRVLKEYGFMGVMLDTANKQAGGLRAVVSPETLCLFVTQAKEVGLMVGLAGSLRSEDIAPLSALHPDYLGFRTALCGADDRTGTLDSNRMTEIRSILNRIHPLSPHLSAH
jgi:(5-formylfuran-3-yl)methyl phosphate synthase